MEDEGSDNPDAETGHLYVPPYLLGSSRLYHPPHSGHMEMAGSNKNYRLYRLLTH
jgi:hypothetical protein